MGNKLEAVNAVLRRMGKLRVSSLDTGGTSTHAQVERMVDDAANSIMAQGWNWNRKIAVSVTPLAADDQLSDPRIGYVHVDKLELGTTRAVSGISAANPSVITCVGHGVVTGDRLFFSGLIATAGGVAATHDLTGYIHTITVVDADTFSLDGVDGSAYVATYVAGGTAQLAYDIYHIDTDDSDINENLIRRGEYMYEVDDNTFAIGDTFKMTYTYQFEYVDIPPAFQDWIIADAALALNRNTSYAQSSLLTSFSRPRDSELQEEVRTRRSAAMQEEIRAADTNLLNTQEMRQIRGRPRTIDRSVY
jgi:hypothetical protein